MRNKVKVAAIAVVVAMVLNTIPVLAGTSWNSFAGELPRYQDWKELSTDTNVNNTFAEADMFSVGGSYKLNLNVYDNDTGKKVSKTALDVDDNDLRQFNLDASSEGHEVGLRGWTANWTVIEVEYSGQFRADS